METVVYKLCSITCFLYLGIIFRELLSSADVFFKLSSSKGELNGQR